jgi:hypothetical protein
MEGEPSMLRTPFFFLLSAATVFAQAAPSDTLQALLAEVHQLRLDLQSTTVTAQRVQILLYRVQLQQATVTRATARADDAHGKVEDAKRTQARVTQGLQQLQDQETRLTNDPTAPADVSKQIHRQLLEAKQSLEIWQNDEQQWQAKEIEAQSQLRAEQARLNELQDTLDRLDKALANLSKQ